MLKITVDTKKILENLERIRREVFPAEIMLVVKANAYGHGAVAVASALSSPPGRGGGEAVSPTASGPPPYAKGELISMFAVACAEEGIELRNAGIKQDILVLGAAINPRIAKEFNLISTISSIEELHALNVGAVIDRPSNISDHPVTYGATPPQRGIKAHLKIDTGMNRFGFKPADLPDLNICENVQITGVYSHIPDCDPETINECVAKFSQTIQIIPPLAKGGDPVRGGGYGNYLRHIAASGAIACKNARFDTVRVGLAAYEGAMRVECKILLIKDVKRGEFAGYSHAFQAERDMRLAIVSGGYADGISRRLSGANVKIGGALCKICGNICMDSFLADVTDVTAAVSDPVLILGEELSAELRARELGTIPYEILCGFHGRLCYHYIHG